MSIHNELGQLGLPPADLHELPTSEKRFPDGAQYRVEIPSTEGPRCLEALLEEANRLEVPVHRVSQGSGVFMLTDAELDEFVALAAAANVELSLFARPNAGWDTSATSRAPAGSVLAASARGQDQLVAVLEDVVRAADHGVKSVLLADVGVLYAFSRLRAAGVVPSDMQAKVSVMLPIANAATAKVLRDLGASTLNLPPDLSLAQIAAVRAAVDLPIDFYVEAPDTLGGFVRLHDSVSASAVARLSPNRKRPRACPLRRAPGCPRGMVTKRILSQNPQPPRSPSVAVRCGSREELPTAILCAPGMIAQSPSSESLPSFALSAGSILNGKPLRRRNGEAGGAELRATGLVSGAFQQLEAQASPPHALARQRDRCRLEVCP